MGAEFLTTTKTWELNCYYKNKIGRCNCHVRGLREAESEASCKGEGPDLTDVLGNSIVDSTAHELDQCIARLVRQTEKS